MSPKRFFLPMIALCSGLLLVARAHQLETLQSSTPQQPSPPGTAKTAPTLPPGKVSGRVLRAADNLPLLKAVVTITPEGRSSEAMAVRSGANGGYEFLEVPPGRYQLRAERNGYVAQVYGQRGGGPGVTLTVQAGHRLEKLDLHLERAGVISGSVADEGNEPVEGLEVRAQRLRFQPGGRQRVTSARTTRTDDLGNFRLSGLAPGFYYVRAAGRGEGVSIGLAASAFGYAPSYYPGATLREEAQRVQVVAGQETPGVHIPVRSAPTYTISGVIIDTAPAAGSRRYSIGFGSGGSLASTSLDRDDGTFTLRGMEPGEYNVVGMVSEGTGRQRKGYRAVKVLDADVRVVIEIGRTAEVRGEVQVEGKSDYPLSGIFVSLQPDDENAIAISSGIIENKRFNLTDVPEGEYRFQIFSRSQEVYLKQVRCAGGEDFTDRAFRLTAGQVVDDCGLLLSRDVAQLAGAVTEQDQPAAGAVVVLIPTDSAQRRNPRHTQVGQTDANGQFRIGGVIPGEYFVFAVPASDDASYYDLEFAERNHEAAERLIAKPEESHSIQLKLTQPR